EIAYQSRSGSPSEPWLGPDIRDALRALPDRGIRAAIVAPIGFLCDHVEVLYDLDIDAKNVAHSVGVRVERAVALNDHPLFIQMLAGLTAARLQPSSRIERS
ncbi:MAG: ferrochelatase, partial [Vulcanimicrobiaceae bacterium]